MPHLRIFNNTLLGYKTRVYYVDDDGKETEISGALTDVQINISVKDVNMVNLTMSALADTDVKVKLNKLIEHKKK